MNKKVGILKRMLCLLLIFLLSINSFAAIVSDNDGSAFITKAEFDALKSSFQAQIDNYNQSIDSKIDGAIASYLSGISITKKSDIILPITNWNEIRWKCKFDIWGSYSTWTKGPNADNPTEGATQTITENTWFEPFFDKRRGGIRQPDFNIIQTVARADAGFTFLLPGLFEPTSMGSIGAGSSDYESGCNPKGFMLTADYASDEEIRLKKQDGSFFRWENSFLERTYTQMIGNDFYPYKSSNGVSGWSQMSKFFGKFSWRPMPKDDPNVDSWLVEIPKNENDVFAATLILKTSGYQQPGTSTNQLYDMYGKFDYHLLSWNTSPVTPYSNGVMTLFDLDRGTTWAMKDYITEEYFDVGCHDITFSSAVRNRNDEDLEYMMLGKDSDLVVNLWRANTEELTQGNPQIKTTYSDWQDVIWKINRCQAGGPVPFVTGYPGHYDYSKVDVTAGDVTYDNSIDVTYRIPYFERYDFKNITSGKFLLNGEKRLKFGEGLPITTSIPQNGTVKIDLEWLLQRAIDTLPTNQSIDIDIKKTNFLNSTNDYYQGNVNGGVKTLLHNYNITASDKKASIKIEEAKAGEAIWIRIAPHATDGGVVAKLNQLQAYVESE